MDEGVTAAGPASPLRKTLNEMAFWLQQPVAARLPHSRRDNTTHSDIRENNLRGNDIRGNDIRGNDIRSEKTALLHFPCLDCHAHASRKSHRTACRCLFARNYRQRFEHSSVAQPKDSVTGQGPPFLTFFFFPPFLSDDQIIAPGTPGCPSANLKRNKDIDSCQLAGRLVDTGHILVVCIRANPPGRE